MRIFDLHAVAVLASLWIATPAFSDDLTLSRGEQRLSGDVLSITEDGVVELKSILSAEPLLLKAGAVQKAVFQTKPNSEIMPKSVIELINGDLLPVSIESMDEQSLIAISPDAGRLEIPRKSLKSIQLGIHQRKVIYEGPRSLEEWTVKGDQLNNWLFNEQSLISKGPSSASRKLAMPRQFILRFELKWEPASTPNFIVSFADPLAAQSEPSNRYYLQFGGAGLEIKRESAIGKRYNTFAILNRLPDQYPEGILHVEIRVNRDQARMQLFLNGEPEGEFADPIPEIPAGSGLMLTFQTPNGASQEIRKIELLEYNDMRTRHRAEDRGDANSDSLISREDDRWSGRLLEIKNTAQGAQFRFQTDFQKDPIEVHEADVSTIFLAAQDADTAKKSAEPYVLRLHGDGRLTVASCRFSGDSASVTHPLLGNLDIRRSGISAMERLPSDSEP